MRQNSYPSVLRSNTTSGKKIPDDFSCFNKPHKVPKPLKKTLLHTIPWTDQGVLHNEFPINRGKS